MTRSPRDNRAYRERLVAAGLCITCRQPHQRQTQRCLGCSVAHSQVTSDRAKARLAAERLPEQERA